ncbi:hypothetical protein B0H16DRAFT_1474978 [Mycena metata]|uniref:Uncharacterized protein n=1 Tax=Mycena metata TaxID=1033252 RepID=A0AAD7HF72_9AGAR|nr:hypothetical protein B0H16DRAFT_1474978 [Mycena metata]
MDANDNNAPFRGSIRDLTPPPNSPSPTSNNLLNGNARLKAKATHLRGGAGSETPEGDRSVGDLRRGVEKDDYEPSTPTKGKAKKVKGSFTDGGKPPKTTVTQGEFLSRLANITSGEGQRCLEELIVQLAKSGPSSDDHVDHLNIHSLTTTSEIASSGHRLISSGCLQDFHILMMYARFRLALHNDKTDQKTLGILLGGKCDCTVHYWTERGTHILNLARGSTFYLLLIIAALGLKDLVGDLAQKGVRLTTAKLDAREIYYNDVLLDTLRTNYSPEYVSSTHQHPNRGTYGTLNAAFCLFREHITK